MFREGEREKNASLFFILLRESEKLLSCQRPQAISPVDRVDDDDEYRGERTTHGAHIYTKKIGPSPVV